MDCFSFVFKHFATDCVFSQAMAENMPCSVIGKQAKARMESWNIFIEEFVSELELKFEIFIIKTHSTKVDKSLPRDVSCRAMVFWRCFIVVRGHFLCNVV